MRNSLQLIPGGQASRGELAVRLERLLWNDLVLITLDEDPEAAARLVPALGGEGWSGLIPLEDALASVVGGIRDGDDALIDRIAVRYGVET